MKNGVWTSVVPFKVVKLSGTALAALLLAVAPTALEARKSAGNGAYSQNDLFQLSDDGKILVKYRGNASEVIIPDGITKIGTGAFRHKRNLTKVIIPDSVTEIGNWAFANNSNLFQITVPASVKEIGPGAFAGVRAVEVSRDNENFYIDDRGALIDRKTKTLIYCPPSVRRYTVSNDVTSISAGAFFYCINLTGVTIHAKVSRIESAFIGCSKLTEINVAAGHPEYYTDDAGALLSGKRNLILFCPPSVKEYTVPDNINAISLDAFKNCYKLTGVTIPDSVKKIPFGAFSRCRKLKTAVIGSNTKLAKHAFPKNCKVIRREPGQRQTVKPETKTDNSTEQRINFQSVQSDQHKDFQLSADGKTLVKYRGNASEVIIPQGITKIARAAFNSNRNITRVVIPDSVTEIGRSAFSRCRNLRQITIPSGVTGIRMSTFEGCKNLSSIQIPSSVTMIESFAFQACHNLEKIIIPNGITRIGSGAFTGVQSVQISPKNQFYYTDKSGALIDRKKRMLLYCPPLLKKYKIPKNVTRIEVNAFSFFKNAKLEELIIPPHVNYIEGALGYVKSVKILPGNRNYYTDSHGVVFDKKGETLIYAPPALENYTVPNTVKWIRDMSFYWCENLSSITIPDSVKTIGVFAFPRTCKVIRR